jgi:hypothetical protein
VWKVDLRMVGGMFLPWWMWPPVLAGALLAGRRRGGPARLALATMASLFAVLFTLRYFFYPHYAAAWTAVFVLLAATGWRHAAHLSRWVPVTRAPLAAAALAAAAFIAWDYGQYAAAAGSLLNVMAADHGERDFWRFRMFELPMLDRATFEEKLAVRAAGTGRGQVAIIEYPPKYFHDIEWVYNGPDIDQQPVIFARSWDPVADAALRAYYPNRDLWRVRLASNGQLQSFTLWNP